MADTIVRQIAQQYATLLVVMLRERGVRGGQMAHLQKGARHLTVPVRLNSPVNDLKKATSLSRELAHASGTRHVIISERSGWIVYQFELPEVCWETYTRSDLKEKPGSAIVGVGLEEKRRQVDVDFRRTPSALITGGSQVSGKSTCLRTIIIGLMRTHTPEELRVLIIDPAGDCSYGLEEATHLALPPAQTMEQAATVIDYMVEEKKKREALRYRPGGGLPMLVLAIDEAQNVIPDAGRQAELAMLGETIGKLDGHLVIASQKPLESNLPGTLFNLAHRLIGQVPTSRDAAQLSGRQSAEVPAHRLLPHGDFFSIIGGLPPIRFQVARDTEDDLARIPKNGPVDWPGLSAEQEPVVQEVFEPELADRGGRPRIEIVPEVVARYIWAGWKGLPITEPQAKKAFRIARTGHQRNRDFAATVAAELKRLRKHERTTTH